MYQRSMAYMHNIHAHAHVTCNMYVGCAALAGRGGGRWAVEIVEIPTHTIMRSFMVFLLSLCLAASPSSAMHTAINQPRCQRGACTDNLVMVAPARPLMLAAATAAASMGKAQRAALMVNAAAETLNGVAYISPLRNGVIKSCVLRPIELINFGVTSQPWIILTRTQALWHRRPGHFLPCERRAHVPRRAARGGGNPVHRRADGAALGQRDSQAHGRPARNPMCTWALPCGQDDDGRPPCDADCRRLPRRGWRACDRRGAPRDCVAHRAEIVRGLSMSM